MLPAIFRDKIVLDEAIQDASRESVVDLDFWRVLRTQQRLTRYSCHHFIKRQRGDRDGGSPSALAIAA